MPVYFYQIVDGVESSQRQNSIKTRTNCYWYSTRNSFLSFCKSAELHLELLRWFSGALKYLLKTRCMFQAIHLRNVCVYTDWGGWGLECSCGISFYYMNIYMCICVYIFYLSWIRWVLTSSQMLVSLGGSSEIQALNYDCNFCFL